MSDARSPLAFCPVHGLVPATAFAFGAGSHNISFKNVSVSCPFCGRQSEVIPGIYDFSTDRLDLIVDPSISPAALRALQSIAERLQQGDITPDEAAEEAGAIDPRFGKALQIAARIGAWAIPAIIALLQVYLQIRDSGESSAQTQAVLEALSRQTVVLEQIASEMSEEQADGQAKATGKEKAKPEPEVKPTAEKPKSKRRAAVNKARREALRLRREQFPPRKR